MGFESLLHPELLYSQAFKWLHCLVLFRLCTSTTFWFINCALEYDFGQTIAMQYMGLINEDLQTELCQKFDILWIKLITN